MVSFSWFGGEKKKRERVKKKGVFPWRLAALAAVRGNRGREEVTFV